MQESLLSDYDVLLDDAIKFSIEDSELFDIEKSIARVELLDADETEVRLQIMFSDTKAISPQITEPDVLLITFALPELFIDEETRLALSQEPIEFKLPLSKQYTRDEYARLKDEAKKAA